LVKGFAVAKNQYILIDKEDLDSVKLESTRIIDIEEFVPAASIDRVYWDSPYHLVPSGKTGIEAFAVIRAAMAKKNMIAIGRLVMSTRERICALEPREDEILLTTLRTHEEVRRLSDVGPLDLPKPDPRMLEIAEKIVEQQRGTFDPTRFVDRYETALREVIERKRKGQTIAVSAAPVDTGKVVDLMEALKKSLGVGANGELKAANRNKPAASKPAGRKPRGSKRAA
jgi:DNA end-binding protein Ku